MEDKDIGFGMVDSQKDAKVAHRLGKRCFLTFMFFKLLCLNTQTCVFPDPVRPGGGGQCLRLQRGPCDRV